jgi:hypothetical protein
VCASGYWTNYQKPVESDKPLLEVSRLVHLSCSFNACSFNACDVCWHLTCVQLRMAGYDVHSAATQHAKGSDSSGDIEYRLALTILPLRCYLDGE